MLILCQHRGDGRIAFEGWTILDYCIYCLTILSLSHPPSLDINYTDTATMFDSFIKPRAEPHLTDPGDAGATDWVMRNPGMFSSLLHRTTLIISTILQYFWNSHVCDHRILRLLPLAGPNATFRTMYQETSQTYQTPSRDQSRFGRSRWDLIA
jgi:hypothetical protein